MPNASSEVKSDSMKTKTITAKAKSFTTKPICFRATENEFEQSQLGRFENKSGSREANGRSSFESNGLEP